MKLTKFFALLCAVVGFAACTPASQEQEPVIEPVGPITLSAVKTAVSVGQSVKFIVTDSIGQNVTKLASIYDPDLNVVKDGVYKTSVTGSFVFYATLNNEVSNNLTIIVTETSLEVPADPQPDNFAFNHRAIFIDHTGVNCGYCPTVVDLFEQFAKTEWHDHYNEVACHAGGYANGDPGASAAATTVNKYHTPDGYPYVCMNFNGGKVGNRTTGVLASMLQKYIKPDGADAGIAMSVATNAGTIMCAAEIKSNVTQEYAINAWLLENNIFSPNQAGATKDTHKIYNWCLRNTSEQITTSNLAGLEVGVVKQGEKYNYVCEIPVTSSKWNDENMGVIIIVSTKTANGNWEVANSLYCNVGESKAYEYVK